VPVSTEPKKARAELSFHRIFFIAIWLFSTIYAAARGGAPERIVAAAQLLAGVLTGVVVAYMHPVSDYYSSVEMGVLLTDLSLFLVITLVALGSTRFWPILQASMMGCDLFGHLAKPLGPDILPEAYYVTVAFWGYPMVVLVAVGTWRHQARLRRYGVDYAWVWQLPRRYRNGWSVDELAPPLPQN
jgi:hypothetical protein